MSHYSPAPPDKDPQLWALAQKRASFKWHLGTYIVVNGFLWTLWFVTGHQGYYGYNHYPWPIWPTIGWGMGLLFHFLGAYVFSGTNSVEKEYEKLIQNKKQ